MVVFRLLFLGCFAGVAGFAFGQGGTKPVNPDPLVKKIGNDFMQSPESVGLSVGIYDNGKTYYYNFGETEKGNKQLPTQNTVYEIGSITKTFASTVLAYAVLEQKVKLEDDIRKYLHGDYPNLAYRGKPIRLIHLANLTSGLPNWLPDRPELFANAHPDSIPYALLAVHRDYTRQHFYEDLRKVKLDTLPGAVPRHSNVGAQLLGYILEGVYKTAFGELLEKYVTKPLGMKNTALVTSGPTPGSSAKGHNKKGRVMPFIDLKEMQPAGGLRSTTADMLKYIRFQLDESNPAVRMTHRETWEKPGEGGVGLNWQIEETAGGARYLWHTGGTFGFSSYVVLYPASGVGLVLLANESDGSAQRRLGEAAEKILGAMGRE
jgi:CubicO group peptidase (beta-lactamase class C family)